MLNSRLACHYLLWAIAAFPYHDHMMLISAYCLLVGRHLVLPVLVVLPVLGLAFACLIGMTSKSHANQDTGPADKLVLLQSGVGIAAGDDLVSDLIQYVQQRMPIPVESKILPTARLHKMLQQPDPACSIGISRVPVFEDKYQWLRVMAHSRIYLYRMKGREQNKTDTVLVSRGSAVESLAQKAGMKYLPITSRPQIIEMLQRGRANSWLEFDAVIDIMNNQGEILPLEPKELIHETILWLVCSKSTDKHITMALETVWDNGAANGELRYLYSRAGLASVMPPDMIRQHTGQ